MHAQRQHANAHRSIARWIAPSLVLAAMSGCGHADDSNAQSEARLSKLGLSYALLAGNNSGTPPSRVEELRHYLEQATSKAQLKAMGVTDAGEMFISPRDGKPYKMIALPRLPPPTAGQPPPVVLYEQVGWQGKRYVAYLGGGVEEVDVDKFQQLVPRPE